MGQAASSLVYSPSTTPGEHPFYFTRGTLHFSQSFPLTSSRASTGSMAPGISNTAAIADGNRTVAGPEYRNSSSSEESITRSIPPPSNFKIYYATPEVENQDFDGWENKLCFPLPITDIGTCCAAGWIPCYLFGKSNWRLEQLRERKDPSNKSYKACQGCNIWCWTWAGLQIVDCGWIGTGFQRNRVRATYGIKGTCCSDFVTAYFCNCCVLMQTDREIQAREGRSSFITNKNYDPKEKLKAEASASQQPIPMQQMRYQPNGNTDGLVTISKEASPAGKMHMDPKKSTPFPVQGAVPSHRDSKIGSAYRNAKSEPPHRKTSDFAWSDFSLSPKNKSSVTQSIHSPKDPGQSRSGLWSFKKKLGSSDDLESAIGSAKHDENSQPGTRAPGTNGEEEQHTDSEQDVSRRSSNITASNWRHNSVKGSPNHAKSKPNAASFTKMSYVHDFTDCPINKSVLDYYDRQQKRIDESQHQTPKDAILRNVSAITPVRKLSTNAKPVGRAVLENDFDEEPATSMDTSSQQVSYPASSSVRSIAGAKIKTSSKVTNSHALDDCLVANGTSGETKKSRGPVEHRVDQCPRHLDGTSSDVEEHSQCLNTNNSERTTVSPSPKGEPVQPSSSKIEEGSPNGNVPEKYKQSDDKGTTGSALTTAVMNGTGKSTEKTFEKADGCHTLGESLISNQRDGLGSLETQENLRIAISKGFPDQINKDGGTPTSQSLQGSQDSQPDSRLEHSLGETNCQFPHVLQENLPKPTLEHALGETRVNSLTIQEQEVRAKSPASELKEVNEKNKKTG